MVPADLPHNWWGKILGSTPVVMTVVATMLAGLASSEMTRAQYDRSMAAQLQSKAGDQWSFFQAKKLRSAMQYSTLDTISAANELHPVEDAILTAGGGTATGTTGSAEALRILQGGKLPEPPLAAAPAPEVAAAVEALEKARPDSELNELLRKVDDKTLEAAVRVARDRALALDELTSPLSRSIEGIETGVISNQAANSNARRDFTAARLRYNARRYDLEARHNQAVAGLYELQVRKNNISAERHHKRSGRFFYGMLAAQMAVIIATFAIAARKRSVLWTIAAVAGMAAIAFAVYVYLYV